MWPDIYDVRYQTGLSLKGIDHQIDRVGLSVLQPEHMPYLSPSEFRSQKKRSRLFLSLGQISGCRRRPQIATELLRWLSYSTCASVSASTYRPPLDPSISPNFLPSLSRLIPSIQLQINLHPMANPIVRQAQLIMEGPLSLSLQHNLMHRPAYLRSHHGFEDFHGV